MTTASIDNLPVTDARSRWIDRFAKKAVLAMLQRIKVGHLRVEDGQETYDFGESATEASISASITVTNPLVYRHVLLNGSVGSGEAYFLDCWYSPDLLKVIRLMVLNLQMLQSMDDRWRFVNALFVRLLKRFTRNSQSGSKKNIAAHYDLNNDFFALFLDRNMMYSAAIFPELSSDIEDAAAYKLKHICERLNLDSNDHLLEIGTGWGGLAIYAAKHYGCKVTTTTISKEQHRYAEAWIEREGLQDQITLLQKDYRDLTGKYDKLVSIEMIEAVGHEYYSSYFSQCSALLKENGLMLIQAITIPEQRYERALRSVDFIQRYIFPGGSLPSLEIIQRNTARQTDMQIVGVEDITLHYADTLAAWKQRFHEHIDQVRELGFDNTFIRLWDFYLNYCEGGFRERVIGTAQIMLAKPGCRQLPALASLP